MGHHHGDLTSFLVILLTMTSYTTAIGILNHGAECDWNFLVTLRAREDLLCNSEKGLVCFNNVCQCRQWLQWEHDTCVTALFRPCSNSSECVSNAKCEERDDTKVCECKEGYRYKDGLCDDNLAETRASTFSPSEGSGPDCVYIKRDGDIKGIQDSELFYPSEPCDVTNGRGHLGDVSCPKNGTVIHMCCRYRQDVQESRQSRFRAVIRLTNWFAGKECVKQAFCEQACLDRLSGISVSSYPIELPTDGDSDKEYVHAYLTGDRMAVATMQCCDDEITCANDLKAFSCDDECRTIFPKCESSWRSWTFFKGAPVFHTVGVWLFDTEWVVRHKMSEVWDATRNIGVGVMEDFGNFFEEIVKFEDWQSGEN